jgi:PTS system mannose-specific IIB component/fructoselysine and glucoselysine-specific PTS system IIB component
MTVVLHRIDDRLVHGQVVVGWAAPLGVNFIALVDDQVGASAWEQDLYRMGVPDSMEVTFSTLAEGIRRYPEWDADSRRGIVLTGDIETMAGLRHARPGVTRINLGGLHLKPGRRERLPYLYLADEELKFLLALEGAGAEITAQDLPTSAPVRLRDLP